MSQTHPLQTPQIEKNWGVVSGQMSFPQSFESSAWPSVLATPGADLFQKGNGAPHKG